MRIGGSIQSIQIAQPAAGAVWLATVPANQIWDILSCSFLFTTGADAANRSVGVAYGDPAGQAMGIYRSGVIQTASLAYLYSAMSHFIGAGDPNGNANGLMLGTPLRRLGPLWVFKGNVHGIQPADQFSAINLLVEVYDA